MVNLLETIPKNFNLDYFTGKNITLKRKSLKKNPILLNQKAKTKMNGTILMSHAQSIDSTRSTTAREFRDFVKEQIKKILDRNISSSKSKKILFFCSILCLVFLSGIYSFYGVNQAYFMFTENSFVTVSKMACKIGKTFSLSGIGVVFNTILNPVTSLEPSIASEIGLSDSRQILMAGSGSINEVAKTDFKNSMTFKAISPFTILSENEQTYQAQNYEQKFDSSPIRTIERNKLESASELKPSQNDSINQQKNIETIKRMIVLIKKKISEEIRNVNFVSTEGDDEFDTELIKSVHSRHNFYNGFDEPIQMDLVNFFRDMSVKLIDVSFSGTLGFFNFSKIFQMNSGVYQNISIQLNSTVTQSFEKSFKMFNNFQFNVSLVM